MTFLSRAFAMLALILPLTLFPVRATGSEGIEGPVMKLEGGKWFDGDGFVEADWYVVDGLLTARKPDHIDVTIH